MKRRGFTLVEVLVVLAMMALLAAILLPAFASVRARTRQASCISNLHQLGAAVALYAQDYDGYFPSGSDPVDAHTNLWVKAEDGEFAAAVGQLQPLTRVLRPYVKNRDVWRCPADFGFDKEDISNQLLNARPTCFDAFGMSYTYRTELTLRHKNDIVAYDNFVPYAQHGASEINVLADADGTWHGGQSKEARRYNVLLADGHVSNMTREAYDDAWSLVLDVPSSP